MLRSNSQTSAASIVGTGTSSEAKAVAARMSPRLNEYAPRRQPARTAHSTHKPGQERAREYRHAGRKLGRHIPPRPHPVAVKHQRRQRRRHGRRHPHPVHLVFTSPQISAPHASRLTRRQLRRGALRRAARRLALPRSSHAPRAKISALTLGKTRLYHPVQFSFTRFRA